MLNQIIVMRIIQFYFFSGKNTTTLQITTIDFLLAIGSQFISGTNTINRIFRIINNLNDSFKRLCHTIERLLSKSTCFSCDFCKFNTTDIHRSRRICTRHFCFVAESFFFSSLFPMAVAVCRCYNWFYEETFH